jgi:hypothetical protein
MRRAVRFGAIKGMQFSTPPEGVFPRNGPSVENVTVDAAAIQEVDLRGIVVLVFPANVP